MQNSKKEKINRLNSLNIELEGLNYQYDTAGNKMSMNRPMVTLPLPNAISNTTYNEANQMLTFGDASTGSARSMTYDNNGNMTSVSNTCGMEKGDRLL